MLAGSEALESFNVWSRTIFLFRFNLDFFPSFLLLPLFIPTTTTTTTLPSLLALTCLALECTFRWTGLALRFCLLWDSTVASASATAAATAAATAIGPKKN